MPSVPRFALRARLASVNLGQVLALRGTAAAERLEGEATIVLSADGEGRER